MLLDLCLLFKVQFGTTESPWWNKIWRGPTDIRVLITLSHSSSVGSHHNNSWVTTNTGVNVWVVTLSMKSFRHPKLILVAKSPFIMNWTAVMLASNVWEVAYRAQPFQNDKPQSVWFRRGHDSIKSQVLCMHAARYCWRNHAFVE